MKIVVTYICAIVFALSLVLGNIYFINHNSSIALKAQKSAVKFAKNDDCAGVKSVINNCAKGNTFGYLLPRQVGKTNLTTKNGTFTFGDKSSSQYALALGDSHMMALDKGLDKLGKLLHIKIIRHAHNGAKPGVTAFGDVTNSFLENSQFVIWTNVFSEEKKDGELSDIKVLTKRLEKAKEYLSQFDKKVFFIQDNPSIGVYDYGYSLSKRELIMGLPFDCRLFKSKDECRISLEEAKKYNPFIDFDLFSSLITAKNIIPIKTIDLFCDEYCYNAVGGFNITADSHHLDSLTGLTLGVVLSERIKQYL
jgi:hypothetical protein